MTRLPLGRRAGEAGKRFDAAGRSLRLAGQPPQSVCRSALRRNVRRRRLGDESVPVAESLGGRQEGTQPRGFQLCGCVVLHLEHVLGQLDVLPVAVAGLDGVVPRADHRRRCRAIRFGAARASVAAGSRDHRRCGDPRGVLGADGDCRVHRPGRLDPDLRQHGQGQGLQHRRPVAGGRLCGQPVRRSHPAVPDGDGAGHAAGPADCRADVPDQEARRWHSSASCWALR